MRGVRNHFRKMVMPHVFEKNGPAVTSGLRVPIWAQVNQIKDICLNGTLKDFENLKIAWKIRSVQIWNFFANVGNGKTLLGRADRTGMQSFHFFSDYPLIEPCMQYQHIILRRT